MNDRTQAGSVDNSEGNVIELMQHRRIPNHDFWQKGINEVQTWDNQGIRVNARYFMQIFDHTKGKSLQRDMQIAIQEPLQYYFAFKFDTAAQRPQNRTNIDYLTGNAFTYRLIPQAKNQIFVRFENLADTFDHNATPITIDVWKFANDLY